MKVKIKAIECPDLNNRCDGCIVGDNCCFCSDTIKLLVSLGLPECESSACDAKECQYIYVEDKE